MKIIPVINADFIYRYRNTGNKVVDTLTNQVIESKLNPNELLKKLNKIGMLNGCIIDHNSRVTTEKQHKLLYLVA